MNPFTFFFRIFVFTLFTGGLWLIPALIFAVFAYFTLKTKTMHRWGHRIEGKSATKMGYVWTIGSVIFMLIFKLQFFVFLVFASGATVFVVTSETFMSDHESIRQSHSAFMKRQRERFDLSEFAGTEHGARYQTASCALAGMVVTTHRGKIVSIVPIFQKDRDRVYFAETQRHGSQSHYLLAPKDCVVSNVSVCSGKTIEAIQLEYAAFVNDRLSPNGRTKSDWVGDPTGNNIVQLNPFGRFIAGIYLRQDKETIGLQLLIYKSSGYSGKLRTATSTNPNSLKPMNYRGDDHEMYPNGRIPTFQEALHQHSLQHSPFPPEAPTVWIPDQATTVVAINNQPKANPVIEPKPSARTNRPQLEVPVDQEDAFHGLGGAFEDLQTETMDTTSQETQQPAAIAQQDDLGVSEIAFPPLKFNLSSGKKMSAIGRSRFGEPFANHGPEGSLLVGFRVCFHEANPNQIINIRPVYQSGNRYSYGASIGRLGNQYSTLLLAKPGYVVSGISGSDPIRSLQVTYTKLDLETLELDWADQYQSDTIGVINNKTIDSKCRWPVVGLYGRENQIGILQIGLVGIELDPKQAIQAASPKINRFADDPLPLRSWNSSSGKYSIEARLKEYKNGKVILVKPDGSTVEVAPEKLSEEDQKYLQSIE